MKHLYSIALLLFIQTSAFSKHIIGGVWSYECLGGGQYQFTMKMYRDCFDPTGAFFDNPAHFAIYKGDDQTPIATIDIFPTDITDIDAPVIPCLDIPDNVCVQQGIYEFNYTFSDWPSAESYHISYQRCCRNATITNIEDPGDVGATFTIELLPASQGLCNNSPVFNTFPPTVICVGEPLMYDHSAFDMEGDQLVYELCSPLLGGAPNGFGGGGCDVVVPDPPCPPPYEEAKFVNPPYSPLNPMGGNPAVTINPVTGMLTGTPNITGQFVVAICVSEYRNGELLTVVRRDFQFNVESCDAEVAAQLSGNNIVLEDDSYTLTTCNGPDIFIENTSTDMDNVLSYRWEFQTPDSTLVFDSWDLDVTFPGPGRYEGLLVLNPGDECGDTASIEIDIFPEVVAAYEYAYDTCNAGPVSFFDKSYIDGNGGITSWFWNLGDGTTDSIQNNPVHVYNEPQVVPVRLEVWDENGCTDDTTVNVVYKPVPSLILVRPNDTISCPPATVFFNNLSSPIDATYQINWDFGDGKTGSAISPTHVYQDPGVYDVKLEIISPIGCQVDTTFIGLIELLEPPVADFEYEASELSNLNPEARFFDASQFAVHWDWYINGELVSMNPDFTYVFPDTGLQEVKLVVTHPEYCQDTVVQWLDVVPKVRFFMPNAFTPNEDTNNELFRGTGTLPGITAYRMEVWDRWGKRIFQSDDPAEAWNGRVENDGRPAKSGVYVYNVSFTGPRGEPFEFKGYATLYR